MVTLCSLVIPYIAHIYIYTCERRHPLPWRGSMASTDQGGRHGGATQRTLEAKLTATILS